MYVEVIIVREEFGNSRQEPVIIVAVSINNKRTEFAQLFQNECYCFTMIIKHDKNVFVHTTSFFCFYGKLPTKIFDGRDGTLRK